MTTSEKDQMARAANTIKALEQEVKSLRMALLKATAVNPPSPIVIHFDSSEQHTLFAENLKFRQALAFYAEGPTWQPTTSGDVEPIWNDYGDTAREALGWPPQEKPEPSPDEEDHATRSANIIASLESDGKLLKAEADSLRDQLRDAEVVIASDASERDRNRTRYEMKYIPVRYLQGQLIELPAPKRSRPV